MAAERLAACRRRGAGAYRRGRRRRLRAWATVPMADVVVAARPLAPGARGVDVRAGTGARAAPPRTSSSRTWLRRHSARRSRCAGRRGLPAPGTLSAPAQPLMPDDQTRWDREVSPVESRRTARSRRFVSSPLPVASSRQPAIVTRTHHARPRGQPEHDPRHAHDRGAGAAEVRFHDDGSTATRLRATAATRCFP
jgi:hypothetical protein